MKQAVIYARSERGAFAGQIAVCRLYAAQNGYRIVRVIRDDSPVPDLRRILRCSASAVIIAVPSVLGDPNRVPHYMTQLNLAGKRLLIAAEEQR